MNSQLMNETVTIYHKKGENAAGEGVYDRFTLKNVRFERRESVLPVEAGLMPYNSFKLYVDISQKNGRDGLIYAGKYEYGALTETAKALCWTVCENDLITEGETSFSLPGMTPDDMKKACEVFTVNTVGKNSLGKTAFLEISGRGRVVY